MLKTSKLFHLGKILHKIIFESPLLHQFVTAFCTFSDIEDVLGAIDPLLESLPHHDTIDHVPNSGQFIRLSITRSHSLGLLSLLLTFERILKILLFVLEVLSHFGQLYHLLLVTCLFPLEKSFGEILLVQIDESKLHTIGGMLFVLDIVFPDLQESEHDILVLLHEVSEHLSLIFLVRQLDKLVLLAFQLLSNWNFIF